MAAWVIDRASISSDFLGGEVVAIHLGTGVYYSLRGSAATIWQALATPVDAATVAAVVAAAHDGAAEAIAADVAGFLQRLREEKLVVEEVRAGSGAITPPATRQPYHPPRLERFADLQDLLLLDPIHDVGAQGWPQRPTPDQA